MTSEFFEEAQGASHQKHATAAVNHAGGFARLIEGGAEVDGALYRQALARLLPFVATIAQHKNVPIDAPIHPAIVRLVLASMTSETMRALVGSRKDATEEAEFAISRELDVYACYQYGCLLAAMEGHEAIDRQRIMAAAKVWVDSQPFDPAYPIVKIWPDLVQSARAQHGAFQAVPQGGADG